MLAINRILKVNDRIKFLIISIKTINLIKGVGVPLGTKCLNILLVNLIHPKIKNPIHIGNDNIIFIEICLVGVKIFGNSPIIFTHKIKKNREINTPLLLSFFLFNAILNCSPIKFFKFIIIKFIRVGFFQKLNRNKNVTKTKIIQFISQKKFVLGSNDKNNLKKNFL